MQDDKRAKIRMVCVRGTARVGDVFQLSVYHIGKIN
jgi:hypothetical protein